MAGHLRPEDTAGLLSNHERRIYDLERQRTRTTAAPAAAAASGCDGFTIGFWAPEEGLVAPFTGSREIYVSHDGAEITSVEIACSADLDVTIDGQTFSASAPGGTFTPSPAITGDLGDWFTVEFETDTDDWRGAVKLVGFCGYETVTVSGSS